MNEPGREVPIVDEIPPASGEASWRRVARDSHKRLGTALDKARGARSSRATAVLMLHHDHGGSPRRISVETGIPEPIVRAIIEEGAQ